MSYSIQFCHAIHSLLTIFAWNVQGCCVFRFRVVHTNRVCGACILLLELPLSLCTIHIGVLTNVLCSNALVMHKSGYLFIVLNVMIRLSNDNEKWLREDRLQGKAVHCTYALSLLYYDTIVVFTKQVFYLLRFSEIATVKNLVHANLCWFWNELYLLCFFEIRRLNIVWNWRFKYCLGRIYGTTKRIGYRFHCHLVVELKTEFVRLNWLWNRVALNIFYGLSEHIGGLCVPNSVAVVFRCKRWYTRATERSVRVQHMWPSRLYTFAII